MLEFIKFVLLIKAFFFSVFSILILFKLPSDTVSYLLSVIIYLLCLGILGIIHAIEKKEK